jgi:hypothetical protein
MDKEIANVIKRQRSELHSYKSTFIDGYKSRRLLPARNVRKTMVKCCKTCSHHFYNDGSYCCTRIDGKEGDAGEQEDMYYVCDGWKAESYNA